MLIDFAQEFFWLLCHKHVWLHIVANGLTPTALTWLCANNLTKGAQHSEHMAS